MKAFRIHQQASAYDSPWSFGSRVRVLMWEICWALFCGWTPKPLNAWRLWWLKQFGATIDGRPFVHGRARIMRPWNLHMRNLGCLGDGAVAYCLDTVEIGEGATIAQEAYLCAGTHDFDQAHRPLKTAPIVVGPEAFVGLRAIVLPGVTVGSGCIVGAGAIVTRDTEADSVYAGNPARRVARRAPAD